VIPPPPPFVARPPDYKRLVPLNDPTPHYTQAARTHQIEGIILMRVLVGVDGLVKRARILRGLPDGLDEEAIRTVYRMRFRPAMTGGHSIKQWITVPVEFKLSQRRTKPPQTHRSKKSSGLIAEIALTSLHQICCAEFSNAHRKARE
jgi:TonB family protein